MMDPAYIRELARQAARKAARDHQYPAIVEQDDIDALKAAGRPTFDFPFIGDWHPRGYRPVGDPMFVDASGFGDEGEAALTSGQFIDKLRVGFAYAVVQVGQFQVYVQEFRPPHQSRAQEAA